MHMRAILSQSEVLCLIMPTPCVGGASCAPMVLEEKIITAVVKVRIMITIKSLESHQNMILQLLLSKLCMISWKIGLLRSAT